MLDTQLLFVDGIPGSGKSTTAQQIYLHCLHQGWEAEWFYEHDAEHPIYRTSDCEAAMANGSMEAIRFFDIAFDSWENLVKSHRSRNRLTILECTLFQVTVGAQLLLEWDREIILAYQKRIWHTVRELNPVLIYLFQNDVAAALNQIVQKRGDAFDRYLIEKLAPTPYGCRTHLKTLADVVAYFELCRNTTDLLYKEFPTSKIGIETSVGDWDSARTGIADLLEWPSIETCFMPPVDLDEWIGTFREINTGHEWSIGTDGAYLYFDDAYQAKLLHKQGDVFSVEGTCIDMHFQRDESGQIVRIHCLGNLPGEAVIGTVWEKLT